MNDTRVSARSYRYTHIVKIVQATMLKTAARMAGLATKVEATRRSSNNTSWPVPADFRMHGHVFNDRFRDVTSTRKTRDCRSCCPVTDNSAVILTYREDNISVGNVTAYYRDILKVL